MSKMGNIFKKLKNHWFTYVRHEKINCNPIVWGISRLLLQPDEQNSKAVNQKGLNQIIHTSLILESGPWRSSALKTR